MNPGEYTVMPDLTRMNTDDHSVATRMYTVPTRMNTDDFSSVFYGMKNLSKLDFFLQDMSVHQG